MKHQKWAILLTLVFGLLTFSGGAVWAADQTENNTISVEGLTYTVTQDGQVSLTAAGNTENVMVPEKISANNQDYAVTGIGAGALGEASIKNVVIPDSVLAIDAGALTPKDSATPSPSPSVLENAVTFYCNAGSAAETFATGNGVTVNTQGVTVKVDPASLAVGQNSQASLASKPAFFDDSTAVSWSSTDPAVATVDQDGKITAVAAGTTTITAKIDGLNADQTVTVNDVKQTLSLDDINKTFTYQAHVENEGWMKPVSLGKTAGTTGKAERVEALKISTGQEASALGISYEAYVENYGWQGAVKDGQMAGTEGKKLRTEAVKMELTGDQAQFFDIYYRVHVENYGWLDWAKNGEEAGTRDLAYRVEAVQIQIVAKGGEAPGATTRAHIDPSMFTNGTVSYQSHVGNVGWQSAVKDGETSGTVGKGQQMEAIKISATADNLPAGTGISYRTHIQNIGWTSWKNNGQLSGTVGRALQMEAIEIKLDSPLSKEYDVYYRAHVQNYGWLDWAKNGESAGTSQLGYQMEAIEIQLVPKGEAAPGSTDRPYINADYLLGHSNIAYQTHVTNIGWQGFRANGVTAGTVGQGLAVEAIQCKLEGMLAQSSSVSYQAYCQDIGWQGWVGQNQVAGTTGQHKHMEAFQIALNGEASQIFDIYYQVHVQNYGWLGWAKNGEWAGTSDGNLQMEAINIKLVRKGAAAPGSTESHYIHVIQKDFGWMPLSDTCICIDIGGQTLEGYVNNQRVVMTPVVTGLANSLDTPRGDFVVNSKESPSYLVGPGYRAYVNYWMPFVGNDIGIHDSTWRSSGYGGNIYLYDGSHGCVNTPLESMAELYSIFPEGTPVYVR
jgi:uncharacterized protein YjdB